jgi:hypothetical protein
MSGRADAATTTAAAASITAPIYLVRMGFNVPIRITTGATISWTAGGGVFSEASMDVQLGDQPELSIFNENIALGVSVLTDGTAGRELKIWEAYRASGAGSSLAGYTEPLLVFSGEMGPAEIVGQVVIRGRRHAVQYSPRRYVAPPLFNHLPQAGTVIEMPGQKIVLE